MIQLPAALTNIAVFVNIVRPIVFGFVYYFFPRIRNKNELNVGEKELKFLNKIINENKMFVLFVDEWTENVGKQRRKSQLTISLHAMEPFIYLHQNISSHTRAHLHIVVIWIFFFQKKQVGTGPRQR